MIRFSIFFKAAFLMVVAHGLAAAAGQAASPSRGVLLISIDGMKPEYVFNAEELGLEIPNLRKMVEEGAYASGVKGVLPTSTFPSHITLITGVAPARHGIYHNRPFDPQGRISGERWDWLNEHIAAPTLWNAAAGAGLRVAAIGWPASVGAVDIHYNIPERVVGSADPEVWNVVTPGLLELVQDGADACIRGGESRTAIRDWERTCYALEIIREKTPDLLAIHLAAGDSMQHRHGPFSKAALEALEEIDEMVGKLTRAFREAKPGAIVCVASDHGFAEVSQVLRIDAAFEREGLVTFDSRANTFGASEVAEWVALRLPSGGSSPVFLKNPDDDEARQRVEAFLDELASNPDHGIASILDRAEIVRLGGNPRADFWIDLKPGFTASHHLNGALTASRDPSGTHGYSPAHREMDSAFFITGEGIKPGLDLGRIDMRNIAPTLAKALGVPFPSAEMPALTLEGDGN